MKRIGIDNSWCLFLDRDGVINEEKNEDYIRNLNEFHFIPGALETLHQITPLFQRVLLVTNQRGIGKGLMTEEDLIEIHTYLQQEILSGGGKMDAMYFAPDLSTDALNRKPNPGMAYQAVKQFPDIDLNKSIMVGNRLSDMQFGKNVGMTTIYLATTHPIEPSPDLIDYYLKDLCEIAAIL